MKRSCLKALSVLLVFAAILGFSRFVHAGNTVLSKIGIMELGGNAYTEWWYTQENPTLTGVAATGAKVTITIDSVAAEVTADSAGNWTYSPTTLTTGDHTISITSGSDTYAFTLHAGQNVPEDLGGGTQETTSSVPATGYNQILGIVAATTLFTAGYVALKVNSVNKAFEKQVTKGL